MSDQKKKSSHVPAQYYGYSLQCTHSVYMLLEAEPGSNVTVEVLDDVASEDASGRVEAVQLKSAASTNPISDSSEELWNTFRNWLVAIDQGELDPAKTTFILRLGRQRKGVLAETFSRASTPEEAMEAIKAARKRFLNAGGYKRKVPKELRDKLDVVFKPQANSNLKEIIQHFQLSFGTQYAYDELLQRMKVKLIDEGVAEDVLLHALGWVKKEIDGAIEKGQRPIVSVDKFRLELTSFRNRLQQRSYLASFAAQPSQGDVDLHRISTFVRQLRFIRSSEDQILSGITDFLSAKSNIAEYAKRGLVHRDSFTDFEKALISFWKNLRDEIELDQSEDEIKRGRVVILRCLRERLRLEGADVPADFVRGYFHDLADRPAIGWHPRYQELLKSEETFGAQS